MLNRNAAIRAFALTFCTIFVLSAVQLVAAETDTEYLKYVTENETHQENVMSSAGSGVPQSAPLAPVTVPSPTPIPTPPIPIPTPKPTPDFMIGITPSSRTVTRGESTSYTVTVKSVDGYLGYVSLSVSGLPNGASYSLPSSVKVSANGSAVASLTVTTTTSTATGNSTLTVTGTGSGTKSASAGLTIQAPSPSPPTPTLIIPIKTCNFDDRRSDVPIDSPMGQALMANVYGGSPNCVAINNGALNVLPTTSLQPAPANSLNNKSSPATTPQPTTAPVVAKAPPAVNSLPPSSSTSTAQVVQNIAQASSQAVSAANTLSNNSSSPSSKSQAVAQLIDASLKLFANILKILSTSK